MRFQGTATYIASDELKTAVNASITLERPSAHQGRTRDRQDPARAGDRRRARGAAARLAHQIDDAGAAGPLRVRRGLAPAGFPARRLTRFRHPQLHPAWQALGCVHLAGAPGAADRRDRQGRHRISQRSLARTRSHGIPRLRDRRDDQGRAPADRRHHFQQREGTARRLPAPLLLPLHPFPRRRHDAGDRGGALSRDQAATDRGGAAPISSQCAKPRG